MPRGSNLIGKGGPGRPAGTPNKTTLAMREWAQSILEDEQVRDRIILQARAGKLPPPVLIELCNRAYGKVKDSVEHSGAMFIGWQDETPRKPE